MFRHVDNEKDPEIEILKVKNEEVLKSIANIEISIRDLNKQIFKSDGFIAKQSQKKGPTFLGARFDCF